MSKYFSPKKYFNKFQSYWYERNYNSNYQYIREAEMRKFKERGFRYEEALELLNRVLNELGNPNFTSQKGKESIHWLLFACISQISKVGNILEIGTHYGEATLLLSKIFPNSHITTVDLPNDDPILTYTYKREDPEELKIYKEKQKQNLSNPRITFLKTNSFFIPGLIKEKFDLIWIDGGHLYPDVAWDICNAYHLVNKGGWIMCDDVICDKKGFRDAYVSPDSYNVLEYIRKRTGEDVVYFLKRETPESSANPRKRKYVAAMRRA